VLAANRATADAAMAAASRIDSGLRVRVDSLAAGLAPRLRTARIGAAIAGSLGLFALGLACVGMFGVFALILGTTARAVAIGLVIGLAASVAGARLLKAYLFGLSGIDPLTYATVALILVLASLAAAFLPA